MGSRIGRSMVATAVAVVALGAAGCGGGSDDVDGGGSNTGFDATSSSGSALRIDDLVDASDCPARFDVDSLPEGTTAMFDEVRAEPQGDGAVVKCSSSADSNGIEVTVVAAPDGTDLFDLETETGGSWVNSIHNTTGVDKDELETAVSSLSGDDVKVLEGRGESLAVRSLDVEDDGTGALFVYGDDKRTAEELTAFAETLQ